MPKIDHQNSADAAHHAAGYAMDRMSAALERGDYLVAAEEAETAADLEFAALMATPRADTTERARIVKDIGSVFAYTGYLRSKAHPDEPRPAPTMTPEQRQRFRQRSTEVRAMVHPGGLIEPVQRALIDLQLDIVDALLMMNRST